MLTIAGGILLAVAIICAVVLVLGGIANGLNSLFDPYGQGRSRDEWRADCAETARHARSSKKTEAEREQLERWFRSAHGVSMDDIWERKVFAEFADVAGLNVDRGSLKSGVPPQPDIRFSVGGVERWAELVEITDQDLARNHIKSLKTGEITGGFFSQRVPLERSIKSKSTKTYATNGAPLDLLAYYDKQFPAIGVEPDLIPQAMGQTAADMIASGVWSHVWVYDRWKRRILWVYPDDVTLGQVSG